MWKVKIESLELLKLIRISTLTSEINKMVCWQYMTWYYEELYKCTKDYSNYIPFSGLTILDSSSDMSKYIKQKDNAT
jgi:hypothetical protein